MKRIAHFSFYDPDAVIDAYVIFFLKELREHVSELHLSSNGTLPEAEIEKILPYVDKVHLRQNVGFDAAAHRDFLRRVGYTHVSEFDELVLLNHTCYGPIFPFSELFDGMDKRSCDLWGPMAHKEVIPNPFTGVGRLPFHITANFIAFRRSILSDRSFAHYWDNLPNVSTYEDTIYNHEVNLTEYFTSKGFTADVYIDIGKYGSRYPGMFDVAETIQDRNPLLKRRAFFHEAWYLEAEGADLPRALRTIKATSAYDLNLIWRNVIRAAEPRNLVVNAALTEVLPDFVSPSTPPLSTTPRIAVCAHIYYVDMLDEILSHTNNIGMNYSFIATTDTAPKKAEIENKLSKNFEEGNFRVLLMEQNRGRDMSSLFITCRDIFLGDNFDLVCRLHTKKSPQVGATKSNIFKRHLLENLLNSRGYVENLIRMMLDNPAIGVVVPPLVNLSFSHFGHAWYANRPMVERLVGEMNLRVHLDSDTPIAPYGTMFWFRPTAIRKLFERRWTWSEFNAEPHHVDGGLAHALERIICYVAQDAGYITYQVMNTASAAQNYSSVEYKLQKVQSYLDAGEFRYYHDLLGRWRAAGYPTTATTTAAASVARIPGYGRTVRSALRELVTAMKWSIATRFPPAVATYRLFKRLMRRAL